MATVPPPLRIGPTDNGRTMTLEEFREAEGTRRVPLRVGQGSARSDRGPE